MNGNFLAVENYPLTEIDALLDRALRLKRGEEVAARALADRVLGLVFFNPSLRTRASMEVAMLRHGGHSILLEPGKGVWSFETRRGVVMDADRAEHVAEAAAVLGRYVDALGVRAFPSANTWKEARRDEILRSFAEYSEVPVINLEGARRHPCQELADALTLRERLEIGEKRVFTLAWAWHPKALPVAVPTSAALAAARLGMEVRIAHPPGFELDDEDMETIRSLGSVRGGRVRVMHDLHRAAEGADVIYAKSWGSLQHFGDEPAESSLRNKHRHWCVDLPLMQETRDGKGIFMHCLPVRRNVVAGDAVLDGPHSVVIDQAENRLHAQRALLVSMLEGK